MHKAVILLGPTASGKTKLSIMLAREINGEIISADSMQVYRYMDIGTAKPDNEEMSGIKHYLINEVNPDEEFSVARYKEMALKYMDEIQQKGKFPVITGGTGLYINSLLYNIDFSETISDWDLRNELKKTAEEKGNGYLHKKLAEVDPEGAEKIHTNDVKRIIRALEVYKHTGRTISYLQNISRRNPSKYTFRTFGLKMDREKLYERINKRVDAMIEKGLADEVKRLVELGYDKYSVAMQGLGYKEMLAHLKGEISLNEAADLIKTRTRQYAKRQMTWFRSIKDVIWLETGAYNDDKGILREIMNNL